MIDAGKRMELFMNREPEYIREKVIKEFIDSKDIVPLYILSEEGIPSQGVFLSTDFSKNAVDAKIHEKFPDIKYALEPGVYNASATSFSGYWFIATEHESWELYIGKEKRMAAKEKLAELIMLGTSYEDAVKTAMQYVEAWEKFNRFMGECASTTDDGEPYLMVDEIYEFMKENLS